MDWIPIEKDERHIARERAKAQALKRSQWWQRKRQRGICHYCGEHFPPAALTMDHIVPLSRGGRSTRGNIVPACKRCNSEKRYFTPVELALEDL
ncbi:MAG: HNH endonuclease [Deltaproteobacteria bacterium]|nr:MAG: HNH endonuclease [Deltaproteobacteria bacterium]